MHMLVGCSQPVLMPRNDTINITLLPKPSFLCSQISSAHKTRTSGTSQQSLVSEMVILQ